MVNEYEMDEFVFVGEACELAKELTAVEG